jgi:hypothetical protein
MTLNPSKILDEERQLVFQNQRAHIRQVLGMRRSSLLLTLFIVFYFVYLITGGVVFAAVEAPEENAVRNALVTSRRIFLETHPCVTGTSETVLSDITVEFFCGKRHRRPESSAALLYSLQSRILPLAPPNAAPSGCIYRGLSHTEGSAEVVPVLS